VLTVIVTIMKITGGGCIYAMLTVIGIFAVLTVIVTITGS
jgi:hypothetical protein